MNATRLLLMIFSTLLLGANLHDKRTYRPGTTSCTRRKERVKPNQPIRTATHFPLDKD
jgi:hypothetical protein